MRMRESSNTQAKPSQLPRPVLTAAAAAILALATGGIGYRLLERHYAQPMTSIPLPPDTLTRLPMQIGQWRGRDVEMDERVIQATDSDASLSRVYSRPGDSRHVTFYVAYGIRGRDLVPHRPEVCYPGAGWTLLSDRTVSLALPDGETLPCRVFRFSRSGLNVETVRVMNFFLIDGQFYPDLSDIRPRIWKGGGQMRYMTRVMLTCMDGDSEQSDEVVTRLADLATLMAGPLCELMPDAPQAVAAGVQPEEEAHDQQ